LVAPPQSQLLASLPTPLGDQHLRMHQLHPLPNPPALDQAWDTW
jgi:hypothetical protein